MWCVRCWQRFSCARFAEPPDERRYIRRDVRRARADEFVSRSISPLDARHPYTTRLRWQHIVNAIANHDRIVTRDARVAQRRSEAFRFVTSFIAGRSAVCRFEEVIDRKVRQDALGDGSWLCRHHGKPVASLRSSQSASAGGQADDRKGGQQGFE
jgi:hypothetical protein